MAYRVNFGVLEKLLSADLNANFQSLIDNWFVDEDLTSQVNGVATIFTLAGNFTSNKTRVFVDGIRRRRGIDYNESGVNQIIIIGTPLSIGQTIVVEYQALV